MVHWFQEPITSDCDVIDVMLSYCLKVTPPQMINLDNIIKLDHDTSSQLDRFDPVLKARNIHNTLDQCLSTLSNHFGYVGA
jgi:hypothetical protein